MKIFKRITAALLLAVTLIVSVIPFSAHVSAATLVYSTSTNSGTRNDVCTTLDGTNASSYYTGNYTYDNLDDLSADALFGALQTLMRSTHRKIASYANCRDMATKVDSEQNNGKVTLLYTSYQATRDQYGNQGTNGWNREHVWPKSLGGNSTEGGGADMHHIRPADAIVNSTRNNYKYGNSRGGNSVYGRQPAAGCLGGYLGGGYYEPLDNVKGDVARICLYVYVRWNSDWGAGNITKVFESVDVLLEWCELDPVDTWEMGRNEVVGAYQGNRNVFIDYPELAWLIFDREIPTSMTTPSGEAKNPSSSGGSSGNVSCNHTSTQVKNKTSATCGKTGYTGDTYCKDCGTKVSSGSVIKATGKHSYGEWITENGQQSRTCSVCQSVETKACPHANVEVRNALSPTCAEPGYSGDAYCKDCNTITVSGEALNATEEHTYETWMTDGEKQTSVCTVCEKTGERPVPECAHSSTEIEGAVEPTCGEVGFSGITVCIDCRTLVSEGNEIPPTGEHKNTVLQNEKNATCGEDGYSGDTYCNDCKKVSVQGQVIPATGEHLLVEGDVISEPTKKKSGLRMDTCESCGHVEGIVLPATGNDNTTTVIIICVVAAVLAVTAIVIVIIVVKKKKKKTA